MEREGSDFGSVLVVCGDKDRAEADRSFLRALGMTDVRVYESAIEAAWELRNRPVEAVLCDLETRDLRGVEFARLVRKNPLFIHLPVLMTGLDNTEETVMEVVAAGASGYLIRPYSIQSFLNQLGRALERAAADLPEGFGPGEEFSEEAYDRTLSELFLLQSPADDEDASVKPVGPWTARKLAQENKRAEEGSGTSIGEGMSELYDEGFRAVMENDLRAAARAYIVALEKKKHVHNGLSVYGHVARACHFTTNPEHSARIISKEIAAGSDFDETAVFNRIMGREERLSPTDDAPPMPSFSLLRDIFTVAGYTAKYYFLGGPALQRS